MPAETYEIEFDGYWRDEYRKSIPAKTGIYCVYSCAYNKKEKNVNLDKLIYIGESGDVRDRIDKHEKRIEWEKNLLPNQELCYSFGPVNEKDRPRCEAALIHKHIALENFEYVDTFPFDETTIRLNGRVALLNTDFTVQTKLVATRRFY